jgi:hypothetical protein
MNYSEVSRQKSYMLPNFLAPFCTLSAQARYRKHMGIARMTIINM